MKILMVLDHVFPPDSRVEKEAISLSKNGHTVRLVCCSDGNSPEMEETRHFTIQRFKFNSFQSNKLSALALIYPGYFRLWKRYIEEVYQQFRFDAIHIHDLPLSKVGYYFKKKYGCKLICDQHEFYSDWIKNTAHMNTPIGKIVSLFSNWGKYEKKYLTPADLVITVAKPLEVNYIKIYSISPNKIITIPNTPTREVYNLNNVKKLVVEEYKNNFTIFYAGGIDILRGIDTAIIALKKIKKEIPNVMLVLCGRITKPYDPFKTAKEHGVEANLIFKGWVEEKDLPSFIAASNVCFFTPPATRDEINKTIATKIYQYAIMQRPTIVSDAKMMKEFIEINGLGISIKTDDSDAFANAVINIYKNKISFNYSSDNKKWYWENTVEPLITSYQKLN